MDRLLFNTFTIFLNVMLIGCRADTLFNQNYYNHWGKDHFALVNQDSEVQLRFDNVSGAGFRSKINFRSGLFHMKIKIAPQKTEGINTNFYLNSAKYGEDDQKHDEIDMELLGTSGILQTNIFANDHGQREQVFRLWFDPSKDFHTYTILWNPFQIVFYVDNIPIRVFKNNNAIGVNYPSQPMRIESSIWNAPWAGQVDWSKAPFFASFQDFSIPACPVPSKLSCSSSKLWWNVGTYMDLNPAQKKLLALYKRKYIIYDYCTKFSQQNPECKVNP